MKDTDHHTLIAYGSLMPGKSNHHLVDDIQGEWITGTIQGHVVNPHWEMHGGYPVLSLDRSLEQTSVPVAILLAEDMNDWWDRLDYFEGDEYKRVMTKYQGYDGSQGRGWIYVSMLDAE